MSKPMKIKVTEVSWHRNGICGEGFHVVLFKWTDDDNPPQKRNMVATVFEGSGRIAVLDADETAKGNVAFAMGNSWRGDNFDGAVRKAIAKAGDAKAGKLGPFSIIK